MTLIDNISFRFRMTDELFARELYADWDGFCQRCVTDVLEEFFYRYDKKDIYMEIGRLDLDLGGIPQEEFYGSFPVRLREALEREFLRQIKETKVLQPSFPDGADNRTSLETDKSRLYSREKRFENLLHYLEYGFCMPEWDVRDFDLHEELRYFRDKDHAQRLLFVIASKPYIMERLYLQTDRERLAEILPLGVWLLSPTLGQYEKQRYLSMAVERAPQSVIRLIHETKETCSTEAMAELLENHGGRDGKPCGDRRTGILVQALRLVVGILPVQRCADVRRQTAFPASPEPAAAVIHPEKGLPHLSFQSGTDGAVPAGSIRNRLLPDGAGHHLPQPAAERRRLARYRGQLRMGTLPYAAATVAD